MLPACGEFGRQSLEVKLEEHVVLARWGSAGLVNTHGEIFDAAPMRHCHFSKGWRKVRVEMVRQYMIFTELLRPWGRTSTT